MRVQNNPAGRLHDILSEARQQSPKDPARKAWAAVFGVAPEDTGSLLKMLADLIDLAHDTKAAIQRLDDVDHRLHLKPFKKIEALLSQLNLDAGWEHWRSQIDDTTLYGLQFSADKLSRMSGLTEIPNDDLIDLRSQLDSLIAAAADADLTPELKLLVLRHLERLRHALIAYRVRGLDGLQEELEIIAGSVVLHARAVRSSADRPEESKIWTAFFALANRLNTVVSLARNSKELLAPAMQALTQIIGP